MTANELLRLLLIYGVVPLWLAMGVADYACHRAARLERTSGTKESILHLAQFAEAGAPLLAALFLEINAGVLILMLLGLVVHQATAVWDVRYADQTRGIAPTKQHIHGALEMLAPAAIAIVAVMHWPALLSLFGMGSASFAPALKTPPLPAGYLASVIAASAGVATLDLEELVADTAPAAIASDASSDDTPATPAGTARSTRMRRRPPSRSLDATKEERLHPGSAPQRIPQPRRPGRNKAALPGSQSEDLKRPQAGARPRGAST